METTFWPRVRAQRALCAAAILARAATLIVRRISFQLRVLCLSLLQDGNVGVGVFPEGEEGLVRSFLSIRPNIPADGCPFPTGRTGPRPLLHHRADWCRWHGRCVPGSR